MPIIFISLSETFINKINILGFEGYKMRIQDYKPKRKTYYISPANSLCFMDGKPSFPLGLAFRLCLQVGLIMR